MLASTFMDLVLGVDIHFELVPMPAPVPTPIPNPFVGMVFDPACLLVGQAISLTVALATGKPPRGPVLINSMPATIVLGVNWFTSISGNISPRPTSTMMYRELLLDSRHSIALHLSRWAGRAERWCPFI